MTEEMAAIRRPFTPDDLRALLAAHGIGHVVLVQTQPSVKESRDFLALAAATDFIAGVVGWVDLTDPRVSDTLAELRALMGGSYLVGARHQVHDESDPHWLLRDDVRGGLRVLQDAGLAFDLLVRARELPAALDTARAFPGLRMIIDHIAKPPIATGELQPWAQRLASFAELEHVSCKISGLVTEADWNRWTPEDLVPYARAAAEWFGEDRLLYGSDWPVCTLAASYGEVLEACESALGGLAPRARAKIFGGNAKAFYLLPIE
jgi:L-fucono-1,5-lactonase